MEELLTQFGAYFVFAIYGAWKAFKKIQSIRSASDSTEELAAEALEEKVSRIPELEGKIDSLVEKSSNLRKELDNQKQTNAALNVLVTDQQSRIVIMSNDLESLHNKVDELEVENSRLKNILDERGDIINKTERERDIAVAKFNAVSSTLGKINITISSVEVEDGHSSES